MSFRSPQFNFLFFGCWNRDNCDSDYRKAVFNKITDVLDNHDIPVELAVVAGDNWYPRKRENGVKDYYKNTLIRGFNMLTAMTRRVNTYLIVGNHNVVNDSIYAAETAYASETLDIQRMYHSILREGVKLHFVDTTLLDENVHDESLNMFLYLLKDGLKEYKTGWNIIIAHHPLILLKKKIKTLYHPELVMQTLQECAMDNPRMVYMCADVHNFHAMDITYHDFVLPTIVCGTGGASPDDINLYPIEQSIAVGTAMKVIPRVFAKPFGFCSVEVEPNEIKIVYHQIARDDGIQECSRPQVKIKYDAISNHTLPIEVSYGNNQVCSVVQPIHDCEFSEVVHST